MCAAVVEVGARLLARRWGERHAPAGQVQVTVADVGEPQVHSRPAWDGTELDDAGAGERRPPILPTFTFDEGRHTHSTWLTEDAILEVARRGRLGQRAIGPGPGAVAGSSPTDN